MKTTVHFAATVQRADTDEPEIVTGSAVLDDDVDPADEPALLRFLTVLVTNLIAPTVVAVLEILVDHFTHR